ncbi:binding-protein-dependent transport systems inner membrane component [[Leptolyngbya] sp. PCC 7376]|uniref:hypothetical protein n=1 Tax=[Leptolyngbya] sp. PCC 7376 TaxID=111781 RepID=UPI00029F15FE|nr:hypothetical protein [[Leptolyngbya] sp. PCC 7376]AFY39530.1 binding-protein-dependent transport systems inner membrane component [[Leptolyngbya] sp. PCC 7376]
MTYDGFTVSFTIAKINGRKNTGLVMFSHVFWGKKVIESNVGDASLFGVVTAIAKSLFSPKLFKQAGIYGGGDRLNFPK